MPIGAGPAAKQQHVGDKHIDGTDPAQRVDEQGHGRTVQEALITASSNLPRNIK